MPSRPKQTQTSLFELPEPELEGAVTPPEHGELAARLPRGVRLGTMSWSYPGWRGIVYGSSVNVERLAEKGLSAYAKHPLLRAVEIDRSYYEPLPARAFESFAAHVPEDFRFIVKAHQDCTVQKFPLHARYGKKSGRENPRCLDAAYATEAVIGPTVEGLGEKLGVLLFQFSPQPIGSAQAFAERLGTFLTRLPSGVPYAVELRNRELFTPAYAAALAEAGAVHCHNVWSSMPAVLEQAKQMPPVTRRPLVVRWLLRPGDKYAAASARFAPFDRIVEEDVTQRQAIARLVSRAVQHDVPAFVAVNNDAEGCAPESIHRLARAITELLSSSSPRHTPAS
jgi:uncharacterized protein YecE (DUF72 family)